MLSQFEPVVLEDEVINEVLLTEESPILKQAIRTIKDALGNNNEEQKEFAVLEDFFEVDISSTTLTHDQAFDEIPLLDISAEQAARKIQIDELKTSMLELYGLATTEFLCEIEKKHDGIKSDAVVTTLLKTQLKLEAEFDSRCNTMKLADINNALIKLEAALLTSKDQAKRNVETNTNILKQMNDTQSSNAKATLAKIKKAAKNTASASVVDIELDETPPELSFSFWKKNHFNKTPIQPRETKRHVRLSLNRQDDE